MPLIIPIENTADPRVEVFRDVRDKDLRGRDKLFMAESEMVVRRLLVAPHRIHSLLLSPQIVDRLGDVLSGLSTETPVYVCSIERMTEIAGFHIHRGALAAGYRPRRRELALDAALANLLGDQPCCILVAEGLTNVDNMGGLFRNAAAFAADAIVLDPTCCDPLYRKAIRVSMGHALSIPYAVSTDWPTDLARLKRDWKVRLVAAETRDIAPSARPLWRWNPPPRVAMLFGSEGDGLQPQTLALCDEVYEIPMNPAVPSLNVAVASAVMLYERQRAQSPR